MLRVFLNCNYNKLEKKITSGNNTSNVIVATVTQTMLMVRNLRDLQVVIK